MFLQAPRTAELATKLHWTAPHLGNVNSLLAEHLWRMYPCKGLMFQYVSRSVLWSIVDLFEDDERLMVLRAFADF